MIRALACFLALCVSSAGSAQIFPMPGAETPRIQTVIWQSGQRIVLTALPNTSLTVMLEPGESITRATLGGSRSWEVSISAEADSFQVTPQDAAAPATLSVETSSRFYEFALETGVGLQAAYLVRLLYTNEPSSQTIDTAQPIGNLTWSYRLRGDQSVRPVSIRDNGQKTVIEYAPGQALPAVFAIGPAGNEEVVDGYMRGGRFIIDRVHPELVFRIDREKATARRNPSEDAAGGDTE